MIRFDVLFISLGAAAAFLTCLALYLIGGRERHLRLWTISWLMQVPGSFLLFWRVSGGPAWSTGLSCGFLLTSAVIFAHGTKVYLDNGNWDPIGRRAYLLIPVIFAIAFVLSDSWVVPHLAAAAVYLLSGYLCVFSERRTLGLELIGVLSFVWAFHLILQTLIPPVEAVPVNILTGLLAVAFAVSIAVAHTQDLAQRQARSVRNVVLALAATVELRDVYTVSHSRHVAALARGIAREMGLDAEEVQRIYFAGLLHDIGKIGVPDYILQKPGGLHPNEFERVKLHPEMGCRILHASGDSLAPIIPLVRHHHERWDGTGYPEGLQGREIPLGAAILAVADAYDAMSSNRSYHDARSRDKALDEIRRGIGWQFHPSVAGAFIRGFEKITKEALDEVFTRGGLCEGAAVAENGLDQPVFQPFDYRVRYHSLLDGANDAVIIFTEDQKIVDWNHKAEEIYGYARQEFLGMPVEDLRSDAARGQFPEQMEKVKAQGEMVYITEHRKKDGTSFPVEISCRTFVQNGQTWWVGVIRDITRRQARDEEIQQRERRYRLLFQSVSDVVLVYDLDLRILEVNEAACQRLGYSREELLSTRLTDIDAGGVGLELLGKRGRRFYPAELRSRDGKIFPVEVHASFIDFEGKTAGLMVARDLRARRDLEAWGSRLLEAVPYPACLITGNRTIVSLNRLAEEMGGEPGTKCYASLSGRNGICPGCLADLAMSTMEKQRGYVQGGDRVFETLCFPLDPDYYLYCLVSEERQT